jgi:hypothetical protein
MSKENVKRTRKPDSWSVLRRNLATFGQPALLALVKDLYELSAGNRDFIQARCQVGERGGESLEKYRRNIVEQFYPARGEAKLKLGEARKAIKDYRKASNDVHGTAELLMTYVEQASEFTSDYGDIDERFYNSVESALDELASLLTNEAREIYPTLSERLARVERITGDIGWGFHEYVADVVGELEDEFDDSDSAQSLPP